MNFPTNWFICMKADLGNSNKMNELLSTNLRICCIPSIWKGGEEEQNGPVANPFYRTKLIWTNILMEQWTQRKKNDNNNKISSIRKSHDETHLNRVIIITLHFAAHEILMCVFVFAANTKHSIKSKAFWIKIHSNLSTPRWHLECLIWSLDFNEMLAHCSHLVVIGSCV